MKKYYIFILWLVLFCNLSAKNVYLHSPNKQITIQIRTGDTLSYDVCADGNLILDNCFLNLDLSQKSKFDTHKLKKYRRSTIQEQLKPIIPFNNASISNNCNVLHLYFTSGYEVEFRAFDNGYAYRFITDVEGNIDVLNEECGIQFPDNYKAHVAFTKSFWSSYEELYSHINTDSYGSNDRMTYLPLLLETPKGYNILLSETDLKDYPCMFFKGTGDNGVMSAFPKCPTKFGKGSDRAVSLLEEASYIARTSGKRSFPWRYAIISKNIEDIVANDMSLRLSPSSELDDHSWIKPGQVSWEWWHDARLYGVDFKSGYNTESYKYYIDFASKYHIPYILMDEGWAADTRNPFIPNKNVNIPLLVDYAKQRNVGILLWLPWPTVENNFGLFKHFADWGISGVKIDFMNRSDQWMVNFYERVAKEAAKNHLVVDFHGSFKPAGLECRYPNVLSYEGVLGLEMGPRCVPDNSIYYPFIRNAVGPMDFTPGSMISAQPEDNKYTRANAMGSGTRAYQMALYIVFKSGLQMLADNPVYYQREHECTEFITSVPVTWDETKVLAAEIGKYIVIAKRKGTTWFIGAITNNEPRDLNIPLTSLSNIDGAHLTYFKDGINADRQAMDYKKGQMDISADSVLHISLVRNGGWAGRINCE